MADSYIQEVEKLVERNKTMSDGMVEWAREKGKRQILEKAIEGVLNDLRNFRDLTWLYTASKESDAKLSRIMDNLCMAQINCQNLDATPCSG